MAYVDGHAFFLWIFCCVAKWGPWEAVSVQNRSEAGRSSLSIAFLLAADLLQSILNEAMHNNLISRALEQHHCPDIPVIQYADDTVLIMPASAMQVEQLENLILHFTVFTGLRVNFDKSAMVPINIGNEVMQALAARLVYSIGSFHFTYLGLPLSLSKPKLEDFFLVIKRIDRRLSSCSTFLSYGDKLTLIKSVFVHLPIFFMCTLDLPKGIIDQINKALKHCFWRKYGMEDRGTTVIAWDKVCLPKDQGG